MYGRRNGRYEGGKRICKKNWIILALICMTSYIFYRVVIATPPSKNDLEISQEMIRNDFKRQMGVVMEKMRAKDRDNALHTAMLDDYRRTSNSDNKESTSKQNLNLVKEKDHHRLNIPKVPPKNDAKGNEIKSDFEKDKGNEKHKEYSKHEINKSLYAESKNEEGLRNSENASMSETRKERKSMKRKDVDIHVFPNGTKIYIDKKTGNVLHIDYHNKQRNGSKHHVLTHEMKSIKLELTSKLNKSKDDEIPETDAIFFFQDDRKPVDVKFVNLYVRGGKPEDKITSKICIHNVTEDKFVSAILKSSGTWEQGDIDGMGAILRSHPDMTLIDGGCNIGAYTVYAATLGNRVIAIDPYYKHLQLLNKSLRLNDLEEVVSLLWNALFKKHLWVNLSQGQDQNLGSVNIRIKDPVRHVSNYSVQTIMLDDLVEKFELDKMKVFLKLDIEGSEYSALLGGINFFKRVNVCYVLMEFVSYKVDGRGEEIVQFMKQFDLYPYADLRLEERLDIKGVPLLSYPINAVFAKKYCK